MKRAALCACAVAVRDDIEEFETTSPSGHIEGLTLRTFDLRTRQWRLYWANSRTGIMYVPQIGQFKNGVGEFYAQDTLNGKSIFVRFIWSKTNTNTPHFEEAFSDDGGKTWEVNWITDQNRTPEGSDATTWLEADGTSIGYKIWGGRANLTETQADLTVRTYNPQTHQWYLYWANSRDGILSSPEIGQFKNGVGEFYATDTFNDRAIIVRYVWTGTTAPTPRFEQAYSDDGGKTWEVNRIYSYD